jgi:hypothetical protein
MGIALALACLSGCALSDPRISGTPPTPTVSALVTAAQATAPTLQAAWQAVAGLARFDPANTGWAAAATTLRDQWRVLVGPDPISRFAADADPGTPLTVSSAEGGLSAADAALTAARDAALAELESTPGLPAVFWAGLAAGVEQVRQGLTLTYGPATPANPAVTVAITDETAAWTTLISRYDETVFALDAATGFFDPADPDRQQFPVIRAALHTDRAALAGLADAVNATPPEPAGIYELPPEHDAAAARALLAASQQRLVEAAAVWVASAADPTLAAPYLLKTATLTLDHGTGWAEWPGWPDAS